jgi:hypothetical protein
MAQKKTIDFTEQSTKTWLVHLKSALEKNMLGMARFGFFLGQTKDDSIRKRIDEESQKHGDIVQIEIDDSYRNLTLKSIAVLNCNTVRKSTSFSKSTTTSTSTCKIWFISSGPTINRTTVCSAIPIAEPIPFVTRIANIIFHSKSIRGITIPITS